MDNAVGRRGLDATVERPPIRLVGDSFLPPPAEPPAFEVFPEDQPIFRPNRFQKWLGKVLLGMVWK